MLPTPSFRSRSWSSAWTAWACQGCHHRHWRCRAGNILSAATSTNREGIATLRFMVEISDASGLDPLLASISSVDSVYDARRLMPGEGGAQLKRRV